MTRNELQTIHGKKKKGKRQKKKQKKKKKTPEYTLGWLPNRETATLPSAFRLCATLLAVASNVQGKTDRSLEASQKPVRQAQKLPASSQ